MKRPPEQQREIEANLFAMAILMPEKMIREQLRKIDKRTEYEQMVKIMADKFNVSRERMSARLTQLELII